MSRHASDRIRDFFAARTRDVTPEPARHAGRVLYAPISCDPEASRFCASVLSEDERLRANRFAAWHDQAEFQQRRAFRRFCAIAALGSSQRLSEISFEQTSSGRSYVRDAPHLWFSFSSCRVGLLGAWSSTHGIGVDLEDQTRDLEAEALAQQYFSAAEAKAVERPGGRERLRTFYELWCLKEAALKAIGEGLPFGVDAFEFELDPAPRVVRAPTDHGGAERFRAYLVEATDGCAAFVVRSPGRMPAVPR
jgi:phosphopantetheinyl transferase